MSNETVRSDQACELINQLEQLLEYRIVCLVAAEASGHLSFIFPSGIEDDDLRVLMMCIESACRNALKSL